MTVIKKSRELQERERRQEQAERKEFLDLLLRVDHHYSNRNYELFTDEFLLIKHIRQVIDQLKVFS